jgi:hypothetical protein
MLQQGFGNDNTAVGLLELADCTASDIMQRQARPGLFRAICTAQTRIPAETRDRCMNCASNFDTDQKQSAFSFSIFRGTGKHHCRHCNRVVCQECSGQEVSRSKMPDYVQNVCNENSMRVCKVCYDIFN